MSHRSIPPSHAGARILPAGYFRMMPTPAASDAVADADPASDIEQVVTRRRSPYAVERHAAAKGWVRLIGFDRNGEYEVDTTIPIRRFKPTTLASMRRWLMEEDEVKADGTGHPTLSLL